MAFDSDRIALSPSKKRRANSAMVFQNESKYGTSTTKTNHSDPVPRPQYSGWNFPKEDLQHGDTPFYSRFIDQWLTLSACRESLSATTFIWCRKQEFFGHDSIVVNIAVSLSSLSCLNPCIPFQVSRNDCGPIGHRIRALTSDCFLHKGSWVQTWMTCSCIERNSGNS